MRRRTRYSLLGVGLVFALLALAVVLHLNAPPQVARLLPESDAILYLNFKTIRAATDLEKHPVPPSPEFAQFIQQTGIQPERDLDRVAFALHRMDNPSGPNGPVAYSEVIEGRFDGKRLGEWLTAHATSQENYNSHILYTIPIEGRSFRVTLLGYDLVAGSNMPTEEQIHSIVDRYEASASPFSGSSLLSARYREVPLFSRSAAWGIGHIGLPFSENGKITVAGVQFPLAEDTDLIASVAVGGTLLHHDAVSIRVEEIAPSEPVAEATAQQMVTIFALARGILPMQAQTPDDVVTRDLLNSLKVERKNDRVVIQAKVPPVFIEQLAQPSRP